MLAGWALVAAGPFGLVRRVALRAHSRGLLVAAPALLTVPVLTGRATDPPLWLCYALASAALLRLGLVRWPTEPAAPPTPPSAGPAGRVAIRSADATLHGIARGTGRFVGRYRARGHR